MEKKAIDISRRGFLTLLGAGGAGVAAGGISGCSETGIADFLQMAEPETKAPKGPEKSVTSVCGQCDGGCSIRVRTVGDRAVSLTGNPLYPLNRNGVCPRGLASLQGLYNPDRLESPLTRVGARGEGKWKPISWNEAIQTVAQRLTEIRERGEPQGLVFLSGETRGVMDNFISRFCAAYGTPNDIRKLPPGRVGQALARYYTQGTYGPIAYDFDNTNYILSFGAPLFDQYVSPVRMLRMYGHLRQEREGAKAKIIQVEPRLSTTAMRADEWVPINPGTDAALALGIAYVLIREGLYDKTFVDMHTFGFDDWKDEDGRAHPGFKTLVLKEFNVDKVAQATGIPVTRILEIAHEFASRKPAIALGELTYTNAVYSLAAVHALNALVGSIDVPGGVVFPAEVPLKSLVAVEQDEVARRGLAQPRLDGAQTQNFPLAQSVVPSLVQAMASGKPYAPSALLLYYSNPAFSLPQPRHVVEALQKVPFIASFSPYIDESTSYADIVLPDHHYLERWQDVPAPAAGPQRLFGLRQPVVPPRHDTMHSGDALIKIAQAMGGTVAKAFPWADFPAALRESVSGIYESRRGSIVEEFSGDKSWAAVLEERGWWSPTYKSFDEFWAQLKDKGGWWDPVYYFGDHKRIFNNPSGRFEFYSLTLRQKLKGPEDIACLPHFEPPKFNGSDGEYPFVLNVVRLMPQAGARDANLPFLQEILGPHVYMRWESWVEMNPLTARSLGVGDGDLVWVESTAGKIKVPVRFYAGAMPNVVNMPANMGHTAYGRWAKDIGANPMDVVVQEVDRLAGENVLHATRVKVSKA